MTTPKPSRRRLTEAQWDAELARAKDVQAADVARVASEAARRQSEHQFHTRTGRRRSWWQRGWKR